jgi:hypothetical protein
MAKRIRQDAGIPSITNPTQEQLSKFFIIAKNLNTNPATVTDDDFRFFMSVNFGGYDQAKFTQLAEIVNRERKAGDPMLEPAQVSAYIDQARLQIGSPENKDRLARIMAEQDAKNKTTAFSNAVNLFLAGTDLTAAQRQVSEYKNQVKSLQRPGALPVQGRDPYLAAALRSAETAPARETVSALAAGQQLGDIYRSELMQAPVAAGGQAGAVGALSQAAATRRRRGAMEMMPALEQIRAQQMGERTQLAGMSAQEGANINRSMQEAQVRAMDQYNKEAQAAAALGAAGYQNRLTALGELGSALTPYAARQRAMPVNISSAPVQAPSPVQARYPVNLPSRVDQFGRPLSGYNAPSPYTPFTTEAIAPANKYATTAKALGMPDEQIQRFGLNTLDQRISPYRQAGIQYGLTERLPGQVPNLGSPLYEFEQQY